MNLRVGLFGPAMLALALVSGCTGSEAERYVAVSARDSEAADRALQHGDPGAALDRLRTIIDREVPNAVAEEDARVIRQDAFDRAARALLAMGASNDASTMIERGLSLGEHVDVFTANLLTTRGRIHESRGDDHQAARDYHRALTIQEALLERTLGE